MNQESWRGERPLNAALSVLCALILTFGLCMPRFALANEEGLSNTSDGGAEEVTQAEADESETFEGDILDRTDGGIAGSETAEPMEQDAEGTEGACDESRDLEEAPEGSALVCQGEANDLTGFESEEGLHTASANAITVIFFASDGGKVVKAIEPDASGNYIITSADVPTAPATRSFHITSDIGVDFSVTGAFEGWHKCFNVFSASEAGSIPPITEYSNVYHEGYSTSDGAIAYSSYFPPGCDDFSAGLDLNRGSSNPLNPGATVVFNPIYKIADNDIAHISFIGISYEGGEATPGMERPEFEYLTPKNYVFTDAQINMIIAKAKNIFGADKAAGYSGIYGDMKGNTVASLKDPITLVPMQMPNLLAQKCILFYLDDLVRDEGPTQAIEGLDNAKADVANVFDMNNPGTPTVEVKAQKVAASSPDYQAFKRAIQVETISDIFDISLFVNGTEKTEMFGTLNLSLPVDPKYNGHTLRVHHYHDDGSIETYDCIVRDGFITFGVRKLSLFGLQDLGVANVYTEPVVSDNGSGNVTTPQEPGVSTSQPADAASTGNQTAAGALPATGDDVSAAGFALAALVAASLACLAGMNLRVRKRGDHVR